MSLGLSSVAVLALFLSLSPCVSAGSNDCESYTNEDNFYRPSQKCGQEYCCGTCFNRYCCSNFFSRFSEDSQEDCITFQNSSPLPLVFGIVILVSAILIIICCCVCPCCCLYNMCRKPQPVTATTTHTTVITAVQQYARQPTATPTQPQSYQGAQYPPYQPVPVQPGYGTQPIPQGYGAQPMPALPYQAPPFIAAPPPTYQEATGPVYPPNPMPYSQAAFTPDHPPYPLQPPAQPQQPNAPPSHADYLGQPAYNPDYAAPPPKTG